MQDIVSVITTFYNDENYILKCINSVNCQLVNNQFKIEYILVNDCSEDSSQEIVNIYFNKKSNENVTIKIINTVENLGCGGARNFGISNSSGKYLMFLDADDYYIKNDFILRAYNIITENDADIVEFGIKYINANGEHENIVSKNNLLIQNSKENNLCAMFNEALIKFMPWTKIIKRDIVNTRKYNTSRTYEDIRTTPYWVYNANKIIIANTVEINYRNKLNSIIRKNDNETRYGTVLAISELFEDFKDNKKIIKAFYDRCLIDLRTIIGLNSNDEYFKKMSKLNTYMLSYIYPNTYKEITFDIEDLEQD